MRHRFQEVMRPQARAMIEELVGRRVIAFMSDNHLEPDMAAEVFVLEAPADGRATRVEEAETTG